MCQLLALPRISQNPMLDARLFGKCALLRRTGSERDPWRGCRLVFCTPLKGTSVGRRLPSETLRGGQICVGAPIFLFSHKYIVLILCLCRSEFTIATKQWKIVTACSIIWQIGNHGPI